MTLESRRSAQTREPGLESVQPPGRLRRRKSCAALTALMFWKTGWQPGLSRLTTSVVGRGPCAHEFARVGMGHSRDVLLERPIAARIGDHDRAVLASPDHLATHERLTGERPDRSHTGASSAYVSSSRELHRSTSTSCPPSTRERTIVAVLPPRPERPENGTTAIAAPRRSSSSQTSVPQSSSARDRRSRAV